MKALLVAVLLCVAYGCSGDTVYAPCSQAALPPAPYPDASRSMDGDKLIWHWHIVDGRYCYSMGEVWLWDGCRWTFDRLLKTRTECGDD